MSFSFASKGNVTYPLSLFKMRPLILILWVLLLGVFVLVICMFDMKILYMKSESLLLVPIWLLVICPEFSYEILPAGPVFLATEQGYSGNRNNIENFDSTVRCFQWIIIFYSYNITVVQLLTLNNTATQLWINRLLYQRGIYLFYSGCLTCKCFGAPTWNIGLLSFLSTVFIRRKCLSVTLPVSVETELQSSVSKAWKMYTWAEFILLHVLLLKMPGSSDTWKGRCTKTATI